MPAVPDFHDPIFENPEVLPAANGGSHPKFAVNDFRKGYIEETEKFLFVFVRDLRNTADVRACSLHPDKEHYVSAE